MIKTDDLTCFDLRNKSFRGSAEELALFQSLTFEKYKPLEVPSLGTLFLDEKTDLIKDILRSGDLWEPHIRELICKYAKKGSTVVDAGAHIGVHTLAMSEAVGKTGLVYAFEPQIKLFSELVHNAQQNHLDNALIYKAAIGERGEIGAISSLPSSNEGAGFITKNGRDVVIISLDDFSFKNLSLVKLDIEGSENAALKGAKNTLLKHRPIMILEILKNSPSELRYENISRVKETVQLLYSLGYVIKHINENDYLAFPGESVCKDLGWRV